MLLLDQMSGGHVVGRNVFSTEKPFSYDACARAFPPSSRDSSPPPPLLFNTRRKCLEPYFCLGLGNYRSTIEDKVHGYGNAVARCTFNCLTSFIVVDLITSPPAFSVTRACNFRMGNGCITSVSRNYSNISICL